MNAIALDVLEFMQSSALAQDGDRRLTEWARWQRGGSGTGYPAIVPFARLVTPTPAGILIGPLPEDVARTDRAVCELRFRTNGMLWAVIEQHYLRNDAVDVKCARIGKSRAGFYRLLDRARTKIQMLCE